MRRPTPAMNTLEQDGRAVLQQRRPARLNLHYIITAWTVRPEDDHRLLGRTLMAMLRDLLGPTDSKTAPKGTIRGDFGEDKMTNVVHASDSAENAALELERFFHHGEIFSY